MHSLFVLKVSNQFEIDLVSIRSFSVYIKVGRFDKFFSFRN